MTIDKKYERQMAIAWMLIAGFQLIPIILNIISSDLLEVVLFFTIFMLSVNLSIKSWQVYRLAEEIEYQSPWISVEERLPEEHTDVIVTDGRNVAYCKKYGDGFYTNIGKCCNVTHWMPIPELPKKGEEL